MEVKAEYIFEAPVDRVWQVLLDPDSLERCMPGCEGLEPVSEGQYQAVLSVGVGAIRGTYRATITVADQEPMRSYRLIVEGNGTPGFVRGEARVSLEDNEGKTVVRVDGDAQVGGTMARVGQRLIGSVNRMMMDQFFNCLQKAAAS